MHIHTTQGSALGNALAGAQAAETATSIRRARELRDAASKLQAIATDLIPDLALNPQSNPETDPQTVSMITAWAGGNSAPAPAVPSIQAGYPGGSTHRSSDAETQPASSPAPVSFWA
jgi:hypothetical protein